MGSAKQKKFGFKFLPLISWSRETVVILISILVRERFEGLLLQSAGSHSWKN